MQEHSKLYRTYLETGMYLIYFFDLMQIGTQTQLFLSIDTQIFDNCANKQKDNRMNKDDNKNKTKTPFSENSSFQEKYTQQSQFFFL